jgi:hypothetical protein
VREAREPELTRGRVEWSARREAFMMGAMESIPIGSEPEPDNVVPIRVGEAAEPAAAVATPEAPDEEVVSWEEAVARDAGPPPPESAPRPRPNAGTAALVEQTLRVGLGLAVAATNAVAKGLRATMPTPAPSPTDTEGPEPATLLTGAALGAAVQAAELVAKGLDAAAEAVEPMASWLANPPLMRGASGAGVTMLRFLDGRWQAEEASTQHAAESFLTGMLPEITGAVLSQIDLTTLVREHVDLNAIAADLDVDAIIARVDMDAIVAKIDMDAIVARIDVDAIVAKVDLDAIVHRMDLGALAQEVLDEIDMPSIIRESSGAMASETVQDVRVVGIKADRFVARIVDKVLRRRHPRQAASAEPADG